MANTPKYKPTPPSRVAAARPTVTALLKTPRSVAAISAAATAELGWLVDERTVRLVIDSLRAGSKTRAKVKVKRVAPNTFSL